MVHHSKFQTLRSVSLSSQTTHFKASTMLLTGTYTPTFHATPHTSILFSSVHKIPHMYIIVFSTCQWYPTLMVKSYN